MMLRVGGTHRTWLVSQLAQVDLPLRTRAISFVIVIFLLSAATSGLGQSRLTDVLVSVINNKVVAVTGVGQSEVELSVGETVVSTKAQGLTALAITSTRLLGFSSQLRHWGEQSLDADEHVKTSHVLRGLCIVATDQHLYGFQETLAHWTSETLSGSEQVQELRAHGHLALAITTERLVGFSAFMSGFQTMALQSDERVQRIEHTGDAYLVKTTNRSLMLRSRIAGWSDVN